MEKNCLNREGTHKAQSLKNLKVWTLRAVFNQMLVLYRNAQSQKKKRRYSYTDLITCSKIILLPSFRIVLGRQLGRRPSDARNFDEIGARAQHRNDVSAPRAQGGSGNIPISSTDCECSLYQDHFQRKCHLKTIQFSPRRALLRARVAAPACMICPWILK